MNFVLRLQQLGLQVSDGHFLLLQGSQILLRVRGPDAMVLSAGVVATQADPSVVQGEEWGEKG